MKKGQPGSKRRSSSLDAKSGDHELVYLQSSLHGIDAAPEPIVANPGANRYAMSASDLMDRSANDSTSGRNRERSSSLILQGSARDLLKGAAATSPLGRKPSAAKLGQTSSFPPSSPPVFKNSIVAAPEGEKAVWEALQTLNSALSSSSSSSFAEGDSRPKDNDDASSNDSSSDSYDINLLGQGMDISDKSNGNRRALYRQNSSTSGGKDSRGMSNSHNMASVADLSQYSEEDEFQERSNSSLDDEEAQAACCGFQAPHLTRMINTSRVANAVVRFAPCFWCFPIPVSATDRTILTRLNILSAIITLVQVASTVWLVVVMILPPTTNNASYDYSSLTRGMEPNLWSLTGSMYSIGFFGAVIFCSNLVTLKVIQVVNLVGAIRYLWVLLYLLPFEIFFVVSLFDFYNVTYVWIRQWWNVPSMAWFRETYCDPGTSGTLCMVPILSYKNSTYSETQWCLDKYEATNCTDIRNAAQDKVEKLMTDFYYANLGWGILLIIVLFLIVKTLERIISRPMVQKSRESNVPAWLSLPFLGSTVVGAVFRYSQSSVLSQQPGSTYSWIGPAFILCGGLFLVSGLLGWFISAFSILSNRDKRYKHISVILFIVLMVITSVILMIIFVASILYTVSLVDIKFGEDTLGQIACGVDTAGSCSNCDGASALRKCPEWNSDDVKAVLQTQTKGSATLAAIFFIYSFSASRFGFVLRQHITKYQIDYV